MAEIVDFQAQSQKKTPKSKAIVPSQWECPTCKSDAWQLWTTGEVFCYVCKTLSSLVVVGEEG